MAGIIMCRLLLIACLLCVLWSCAAVVAEATEEEVDEEEKGEATEEKEEEDANVSEIADDATKLLALAKEVEVAAKNKNGDCAKCGELAAKAKVVAEAAEKVVNTSKKAVEAYRDARMPQSAHSAALLETASQVAWGNAMTVEHTANRIAAVPRAVSYLKRAENALVGAKSNVTELENDVVKLLKNVDPAKISEQEIDKLESPVRILDQGAVLAKASADSAMGVLRAGMMGTAVNRADELKISVDVVIDQVEKVRNISKTGGDGAAVKDALQRLKDLAADLRRATTRAKDALRKATVEAESLTTEEPQRAAMQAAKLLEEATNMVRLEELTRETEAKEESDMAAALRKSLPDELETKEETRANDGSYLAPLHFVDLIVPLFLFVTAA